MSTPVIQPDPRSAVCVDMGTTNTRVWLVKDGKVLARAQEQVGVRDTAREGSSIRLREALRSLIASVIHESKSSPTCVIAAGMITSALGLAEVPHIAAPAGLKELAGATRTFQFSDVTELPVLLVPGIRCGPVNREAATLNQSDIMRGEETLCVGLVALGLVPGPAVVLNLGSHWKAIQIDSTGRVSGSVTSLSGEMIHAVQTTTILASAVPQDRPAALEYEWVQAGMREQRRSGLARALFCVRLLQTGGDSTPGQRFAFLIGAFIAADLDALRSRGVISTTVPVWLVGTTALTGAWQQALAEASVKASVIDESDIEKALLGGLDAILNKL